ncbi:MAG: PEP-CTERM sorting domain-containing protein [Desulfobulbus sp.]
MNIQKINKLRTPLFNSRLAMALLISLVAALPYSANAALIEHSLEFTDNTSGAIGSGSFFWDSDTEIMTGLTWNFSGKIGTVLDTALASTYSSWDPLATTYGELYYRFLTDPAAFLNTHYNPLSISVGLMPSNVTGDFGFIGFGAERGNSDATYIFYDTNWNLVSEGWVSAAPVPEPSTMLLFGVGSVGLAVIGRRKRI